MKFYIATQYVRKDFDILTGFMTEKQKTFLNALLALVTLLLTGFLWRRPFVLVPLLALIAVAMVRIEKHKSAIYIYVVAFCAGPLSEALVIYFGAWAYAEPYILGVPLWLPFIWGNAGLFIHRLNQYVRSRVVSIDNYT